MNQKLIGIKINDNIKNFKKLLHQFNGRLDIAKEKMSELEFMSKQNIQSIVTERQKEKKKEKTEEQRSEIEEMVRKK